MGVGFGGGELGLLGGDLVEDLLLVELGEDLALLDVIVDVDVEAGDDAGGLGFDLDLGDGLDFAGGDDGAGDVGELGLAELGGLEFGGVAAGRDGDAEGDDYDEDDEAGPEPDFPFVLTLCSQGVLPYDSGWWVVSECGYARRVLRGSIDGGESCCKDAELLPAPILDVRQMGKE